MGQAVWLAFALGPDQLAVDDGTDFGRNFGKALEVANLLKSAQELGGVGSRVEGDDVEMLLGEQVWSLNQFYYAGFLTINDRQKCVFTQSRLATEMTRVAEKSERKKNLL